MHVTFVGLLFIDGYLVLKDQWTKQIISDIWGAKIWKRSQNSIVKFGKYCKLVFVSCFHYFFSATILIMKWSLRFLLKKKKKLTAYLLCLCAVFEYLSKRKMLKINVLLFPKEKDKLRKCLVIMGDKSKAGPFINQTGELFKRGL